jgi:hypothetical protein
MKFFNTINANLIPDDKFKIKFFSYSILMPIDKIIDNLYLRRIVDDIIDPQIGMIQYFIL